MSGIAEAMSNITSGKRTGGIAERMEGSGGEERQEEQDGGVESHLKALHEKMGGKHMHIHQHEGGYTSHQIGDDGKTEGPQDHQSIDELKEQMDRFLSEEEQEQPSNHHDHDDGLM